MRTSSPSDNLFVPAITIRSPCLSPSIISIEFSPYLPTLTATKETFPSLTIQTEGCSFCPAIAVKGTSILFVFILFSIDTCAVIPIVTLVGQSSNETFTSYVPIPAVGEAAFSLIIPFTCT